MVLAFKVIVLSYRKNAQHSHSGGTELSIHCESPPLLRFVDDSQSLHKVDSWKHDRTVCLYAIPKWASRLTLRSSFAWALPWFERIHASMTLYDPWIGFVIQDSYSTTVAYDSLLLQTWWWYQSPLSCLVTAPESQWSLFRPLEKVALSTFCALSPQASASLALPSSLEWHLHPSVNASLPRPLEMFRPDSSVTLIFHEVISLTYPSWNARLTGSSGASFWWTSATIVVAIVPFQFLYSQR